MRLVLHESDWATFKGDLYKGDGSMIPSALKLARRRQRILVVDDAASTRALVAFHLQEAGYRVWDAATKLEALQLVEQWGVPDLVVLDLQLNDLAGSLLAQWLTQVGAPPCLFVGPASLNAASVNLADLLVKPLVISQLLTAVQQRLPDPGGSIQALPDVQVDSHLSLNFAEHYAILNDQQIQLSVAASTLLEQLYLHRGQALTTAFLRDKIRAADPTARRSTAAYVYYLRQKLETHPAHRRYIRSLQGQGYLMPSVCLDRQPAVLITIPRQRRQREDPPPAAR